MLKKKRTIACLAAVICLLLFTVVGINATSKAYADNEIGVFAMENGASIRVAADETYKDGLRFRVKMDETTLNAAKAENASLFVVIAPSDVIGSSYDFSGIAEDKWVKINENNIYPSGGFYYANAVIANVKTTNRYRKFTARAVIKNGDNTVWAELAEEGYRDRSIYEVVNKATLGGKENVERILNGDTTYKSWYGTSAYPMTIEEEDQIDGLISAVSSSVSFADKYIAVGEEVKLTETFKNAVAEDGALNALSENLNATYHTATFKNGDEILYTYSVKDGETPAYNGYQPEKADENDNSFTFIGFDKEFAAITQNSVYSAIYKASATDAKGNFGSVYHDKKVIDDTEKAVTRISGITLPNRYPYVIFQNEVELAENKALTFAVYNNSDKYEFAFIVYLQSTYTALEAKTAYKAGTVIVEPEQTQTFTLYACNFDFAANKYLIISTSHYITSSGQAEKNMVEGVNEDDLAAFDICVYDFKIEEKTKPDTEDYKQATEVSATQVNCFVNTNKNFVAEGEYSLAFNSSGNYPYVYLDYTRSFDWTTLKEVSFKIYNPYTSPYTVNVDVTAGTGTTASNLCKQVVNLSAGEWSTVTINCFGKDIQSDSAIIIWSGWSSGENATENGTKYSASNNLKWRAFRLYVDGISSTAWTDEEWIDEAGIISSGGYTGSFTATVNTDGTYIKSGVKSLVLTAAGTWNTCKFDCLKADAEFLKGKTLKAFVYNPNDFDLYVGIGGDQKWDTHKLSANGCTEVVIDSSCYSTTTATNGYLEIRLGNTDKNLKPNTTVDTVKDLKLYVDFSLE